jgi:hypothetical protein
MNLVYGVQQVMHRIRVKLYRNYFPKGGPYIARTDSEATLNIDQVGAARRDRGGLTMDFEDFIDGVKQFFEEMIYQLCDGFAVNTGYFTIYPNLGGTFKSVHETPDPKTHPLTFRFHARKPLRDIASGIHIVVEGLADVEGWIDEYRDTDEDAVNSIFIPGDQFVINGHKIKIAGDDPVVGLFFVPVDNPSAAVKVTRLAENSTSKIIGIAPQTGHQFNKVEVRTLFAGSGGVFLKTMRIITSDFTLEEA